MILNWGHGLAIALAIFAAIMITFLVNSFTTDHELVTENYYQEELAFQDQITKRQNAKRDGKTFKVSKGEKEVVFSFQLEDTAFKNGSLNLLRPSDSKLDKEFPLALNKNAEMVVPFEEFEKGSYIISANWQIDTTSYFVKQKFYF